MLPTVLMGKSRTRIKKAFRERKKYRVTLDVVKEKDDIISITTSLLVQLVKRKKYMTGMTKTNSETDTDSR